MQNIKEYMQGIGQAARAASHVMAQADTRAKNLALQKIAAALLDNTAQLIAENAKDVAAAQGNELDAAAIDRLTLTEKNRARHGRRLAANRRAA